MIIFGHISSQGDFPWMAAIYIKDDEGRWKNICGGTLISPSLVLTGNILHLITFIIKKVLTNYTINFNIGLHLN